MHMADGYEYWREELKGVKHSRDTLDKIWGFWRIVGARTKPDFPFAAWSDGGEGTLLKLSRKDPIPLDGDEGYRMFQFQWPHAIAVTRDEYNLAIDTGYWSDGKPSRKEENVADEKPLEWQSNFAPANEVIAERINLLIEKIDALLPINSKEAADKASELGVKLKAAVTEGDGLFKTDLAPAEEAVNAVKTKWAAVKTGDTKVTSLRAAIRAWLKLEEQRVAKEAAEAAAKAAETGQPAPAAEPAKVEVTPAYGRKTTLRTVKRGRITDATAFVAALENDGDLKDLLQRKANAFARSGITMPGVEIYEDRE